MSGSTRCFARGNQFVALDLSAAAAEVLYDGCLVVGGEPTLFQVHAGKDKPATLRIVQTTLIASQSLLSLDGVGAGIGNPALNWFGWDALLSRANRGYGGRMVTLGRRQSVSQGRPLEDRSTAFTPAGIAFWLAGPGSGSELAQQHPAIGSSAVAYPRRRRHPP